jgi:hypothetical protein
MKPESSLPHCHISLFTRDRSRLCVALCNTLIFFCDELSDPLPTPKLEGDPLSAVRYCLFNIFAATLHIWWPPPPAIWGRVMSWQGIHLTLLPDTHVLKKLRIWSKISSHNWRCSQIFLSCFVSDYIRVQYHRSMGVFHRHCVLVDVT